MSRGRWYLVGVLCVAAGVAATLSLARLEAPAAVGVGAPAPEVVARRVGPGESGRAARLSE